jgi:hypothetical protein
MNEQLIPDGCIPQADSPPPCRQMLSFDGPVSHKTAQASRYEATIPAISCAATTSAVVPPAIAFFRLSGLLTFTEWVSIPRAVNALKTSRRWVWSLIPEVGGGLTDE